MSLVNQNTEFAKTAAVPQLQQIDYIEIYAGNARQAAQYYRTAFGFEPIAYAGLESGLRDRASIILQRDECHLLVTAPLSSDGPVAEYVLRHGDGVKDIAFRVTDAARAFTAATRWGAQPLLEPTHLEDEHGHIVKATVAAYGDTVHSFIQRDTFIDTFLPAYQPMQSRPAPWSGLQQIDHFAISLPPGEVQSWVNFYTQVFGFHQLHEEGITTEYSAMNSIAVENSNELIKFVLIEPRSGKRKSQIEEFLKFHQGPGVQHVALHSEDIIKTIHALQANGVGFVQAPGSYYDMLTERVGTIDEDVAALREVNVLVDRDEWGYLLQIFSLPVQSRPTLFIEIIQRKAARGFGSGNIQALFRALELEQARRGNL